MGHWLDGTHDGWTPPHDRRIVPRCGRIQVASIQGRQIQRPHGTYMALSDFQEILNGNNLCPTFNPNQ